MSTSPAPTADSTPMKTETAAPPKDTSKPAKAGTPPMIKLKHGLLKIVDLSALGFLEPIVRLCYGEEPQVQLRKIGRFVVIPLAVILAAFLLWTALAPLLKTKSGSLPGPGTVLSAFNSVMNHHNNEIEKKTAFWAEGEERTALLESANERIAKIEPLQKTMKERVEALQAKIKGQQEEQMTPLLESYDKFRENSKTQKKERKTALETEAEGISANDTAAKAAYATGVAEYLSWVDNQNEERKSLKAQQAKVLSAEYPELRELKMKRTSVDDEALFLAAYKSTLENSNREVRVSDLKEKLAETNAKIASGEGKDLFKLTTSSLKLEGRIDETMGSKEPWVWTFPRQIFRSIFCVFTGFVVASLIAVPLGVLCGLWPTFMAAMTPFIALFKPVSPIVWLLVVMIIVGAQIPDPNNSVLLNTFSEIPYLGRWLAIDPSFINSAITVALCSLWATLVNTALGVASVDKDHLNVAKVLRLGFWARLRKIILPSALPLMFAGMRISLGVGWMVLIAAELLSNSQGIGVFVWDQFNNGADDSFAKIIMVVFVVGIIGLILDRIMIVFQRLVSFEGSVAAI